MKSPAHDLALYLADIPTVGTFGGSAGWTIHVSREPPTPEKAITLYDTGGDGPDTDELDLLQPAMQVRVRALDYAEAYEKQEQIRDLLILPGKVETANSVFVGIMMTSDILSLGVDDQNRHVLTSNYRAIRQRS